MAHKSPSLTQSVTGLALADGTNWGIAGGNEEAQRIVFLLADAMQMRPNKVLAYQLLVLTEGHGVYTPAQVDHRLAATAPWTVLPPDDDNTFTCIVSFTRNDDMLANQLLQLSLVIARQAQDRGGFLLHGALAEKSGSSVILAGPGGVGKTTASRRLPSSWRSLSDDATLIVCDEEGAYWAHPWPTWSCFMSGGRGGTWDVNHAVPLKAIFFLQQAGQDRVEPVAYGQSVCRLVELAEHTSWSMAHGTGKKVARTLRLKRFENICDLVKVVPCYNLYLSLDGSFWDEIERVIIEHSCKGT